MPTGHVGWVHLGDGEEGPVRVNPFERLEPVGPSYARLPVLQAFNWSECLAGVEGGEWYVVAFRSIRNVAADPELLKALDDRAYEEATREPGLLMYFRGSMNERRECLSICVWESQQRARAATTMPSHRAAAEATDALYTLFELERWMLSKRHDSGILDIHPVRVEGSAAARYASAVTQDRAGMWLAPDRDSL